MAVDNQSAVEQGAGCTREPAKGLIAWMGKSPVFSLPRRLVWKGISAILAQKGMTITPAIREPGKVAAYELIDRVIAEEDMLLLREEAYQLLSAVRHTGKIDGDIAEVGVYRGASARLICEFKGDRALHLFDTFEGLPETTGLDDRFQSGQYQSSYSKVKKYLAPYPGVALYQGYFPATSGPVEDRTFSFVHVDVDLHEPIKNCLEFFYPRMRAGGIILIHDYAWAQGVRLAVDEFLADKPEPLMELAGAYCGIVKCNTSS